MHSGVNIKGQLCWGIVQQIFSKLFNQPRVREVFVGRPRWQDSGTAPRQMTCSKQTISCTINSYCF